MTTVPPTPQPVNPPSLRALLDASLQDLLSKINCARPGVIVSFDPGVAGQRPATATVKIAQLQVTAIDKDGTESYAAYPNLELVPVIFLGGGGYSFTFPVAAGDECLLVFNDREIDNWFANGPGLPPSRSNFHDFGDAFCIVGLQSGPKALANGSASAVQLISHDYSGPGGAGELISAAPGKIQIIANEVVIHGRNKLVTDAGGTGTVVTPSLITNYTQGVTVNSTSPTPPEVPQ